MEKPILPCQPEKLGGISASQRPRRWGTELPLPKDRECKKINTEANFRALLKNG